MGLPQFKAAGLVVASGLALPPPFIGWAKISDFQIPLEKRQNYAKVPREKCMSYLEVPLEKCNSAA